MYVVRNTLGWDLVGKTGRHIFKTSPIPKCCNYLNYRLSMIDGQQLLCFTTWYLYFHRELGSTSQNCMVKPSVYLCLCLFSISKYKRSITVLPCFVFKNEHFYHCMQREKNPRHIFIQNLKIIVFWWKTEAHVKEGNAPSSLKKKFPFTFLKSKVPLPPSSLKMILKICSVSGHFRLGLFHVKYLSPEMTTFSLFLSFFLFSVCLMFKVLRAFRKLHIL